MVTGYSQRILDDGRTESTFHTRGSPTLAHLEWLAPPAGSGWIGGVRGRGGLHDGPRHQGWPLANARHERALERRDHRDRSGGFSIERTASEVAGLNLLQSAEWQGLDAVKRGACTSPTATSLQPVVVRRRRDGGDGRRDGAARSQGLVGPPRQALGRARRARGPLRARARHRRRSPSSSRKRRRGPSGGAGAVPAATLKFAPPAKHVEHQVELLRAGKFDEAFAMNSTPTRRGSAGGQVCDGGAEQRPSPRSCRRGERAKSPRRRRSTASGRSRCACSI